MVRIDLVVLGEMIERSETHPIKWADSVTVRGCSGYHLWSTVYDILSDFNSSPCHTDFRLLSVILKGMSASGEDARMRTVAFISDY